MAHAPAIRLVGTQPMLRRKKTGNPKPLPKQCLPYRYALTVNGHIIGYQPQFPFMQKMVFRNQVNSRYRIKIHQANIL